MIPPPFMLLQQQIIDPITTLQSLCPNKIEHTTDYNDGTCQSRLCYLRNHQCNCWVSCTAFKGNAGKG